MPRRRKRGPRGPQRITEATLAKHGLRWASPPHDLALECVECNNRWTVPEPPPGERAPAGWWRCSGCCAEVA